MKVLRSADAQGDLSRKVTKQVRRIGRKPVDFAMCFLDLTGFRQERGGEQVEKRHLRRGDGANPGRRLVVAAGDVGAEREAGFVVAERAGIAFDGALQEGAAIVLSARKRDTIAVFAEQFGLVRVDRGGDSADVNRARKVPCHGEPRHLRLHGPHVRRIDDESLRASERTCSTDMPDAKPKRRRSTWICASRPHAVTYSGNRVTAGSRQARTLWDPSLSKVARYSKSYTGRSALEPTVNNSVLPYLSSGPLGAGAERAAVKVRPQGMEVAMRRFPGCADQPVTLAPTSEPIRGKCTDLVAAVEALSSLDLSALPRTNQRREEFKAGSFARQRRCRRLWTRRESCRLQGGNAIGPNL